MAIKLIPSIVYCCNIGLLPIHIRITLHLWLVQSFTPSPFHRRQLQSLSLYCPMYHQNGNFALRTISAIAVVPIANFTLNTCLAPNDAGKFQLGHIAMKGGNENIFMVSVITLAHKQQPSNQMCCWCWKHELDVFTFSRWFTNEAIFISNIMRIMTNCDT